MKYRKIQDKLIRYIIVVALVFFIFWGILDIINKNYDFVADRFLEALIALSALLLYKRMHLSLLSIIIGLIPVILHSLGFYTEIYMGIPFDQILHFTAGLAVAMIFSEYFYFYEGRKRKHMKIFFLSVCVTAGLGSFVEIIEWLGYKFLGTGGGILFYGAGDHGGWNNASMDMISNTLGAALGYFIAFFRKQ